MICFSLRHSSPLGGAQALEITPDAPVSPRLLAGVDRYQGDLRRLVPGHAEGHHPLCGATAGAPWQRRGPVFSGGIDSTYAFLRHRDEITHLVFCVGFDVIERSGALRGGHRLESPVRRRPREEMGDRRDNARDLPVNTPLWDRWGSSLIGIALALGFSRAYIGASHAYDELMPWDTHPLTDPLLSTETTEIVHDGAERRSTKLRRIVRDSTLGLEILRVCNASDQYNCGKCEKCLRTMVALHLLGERSPSLPALASVRALKPLYIADDSALTFWEDNLRLARERGTRPLIRMLASKVRGYKIRRLLKEIDRDSFSGFSRARGSCEAGGSRRGARASGPRDCRVVSAPASPGEDRPPPLRM